MGAGDWIAFGIFAVAILGLLLKLLGLAMERGKKDQSILDEIASLRRHHNGLQQSFNDMYVTVQEHKTLLREHGDRLVRVETKLDIRK